MQAHRFLFLYLTHRRRSLAVSLLLAQRQTNKHTHTRTTRAHTHSIAFVGRRAAVLVQPARVHLRVYELWRAEEWVHGRGRGGAERALRAGGRPPAAHRRHALLAARPGALPAAAVDAAGPPAPLGDASVAIRKRRWGCGGKGGRRRRNAAAVLSAAEDEAERRERGRGRRRKRRRKGGTQGVGAVGEARGAAARRGWLGGGRRARGPLARRAQPLQQRRAPRAARQQRR